MEPLRNNLALRIIAFAVAVSIVMPPPGMSAPISSQKSSLAPPSVFEAKKTDVTSGRFNLIDRTKSLVQWIRNHWLTAILLIGTLIISGPYFYNHYYVQFFGHLFGLNVLSGADLPIYYWGPEVWFKHGLDPYMNVNWEQLINQDAFQFSHPNPAMQRLVGINILGRTPDPGDLYGGTGYVGSPVNLLIFAVINLIPFGFLYNLWPIISLAAQALVIAQFRRALDVHLHGATKWSKVINSVLLLTLMFFPALASALSHASIEVLYFSLIGFALYQYAFRQNRAMTPLFVGSSLAAAGIKVFPGILAGYFVIRAIKELWGKGRNALNQIVVKTGLWTLAASGGLALITFGTLGSNIIHSWLYKASRLAETGDWASILASPTWLNYYSIVLGGLGLSHFIVVAGVVSVLGLLAMRELRRSTVLTLRDETIRFLLSTSLLLTILPTIMPHWWDFYNAIMTIPILIAFCVLKYSPSNVDTTQGRWIQRVGLVMVALSYLSLNYDIWYRVLDVFNIPHIAAEYAFMDAGFPLNRIMRAFAGYPGTLLLFTGLLLAHRWAVKTGLLSSSDKEIIKPKIQPLNNEMKAKEEVFDSAA